MPTFDDYIERVAQAVSDGTRRAYTSYWNRIRQAWGTRRLDEPTPLEIKQLAERFKADVVQRRNARGGRSAAEHIIAALRCVYSYAVADGLITEAANPAIRVAKPRRLASTRRALPDAQLAQIVDVAATTGNDPELDCLLLTAAHRDRMPPRRRTRAAPLRPRRRAMPRPAAGEGRDRAVAARLANPDAPPARARRRARRPPTQPIRSCATATASPITTRRYDHLWQRLGKHLPWVAAQQVSTHWLRHTTLTWVERNFSYAIARAYAGHTGKNDAGTTSTYVRADIDEVATALAALDRRTAPPRQSGQPHGSDASAGRLLLALEGN